MSKPPSLSLSFTHKGEHQVFELQPGETLIGRSPKCEVVIPSESVSRRHAAVISEGDAWFVSDLGSKNGVLVGGARTQRRRLANGDVIRLGSVELTCQLQSAPVPVPATVQFDDEGPATFTGVIDMDDLDTLLHGGASGSSPAAETARDPLSTSNLRTAAAGGWIVRLFYEAAEGLLSCPALEGMFDRILALVFNHLPAQRASILLCSEGGGEEAALNSRAVRTLAGAGEEPITISRNIVRAAIQSRQATLVEDTARDDAYRDIQSIVAMNIRSAMCAPLSHGGRVAGLIYVDTQDLQRPFTRDHLEILSTLAVLSAVAVEQTRLKESVLREQAIRNRCLLYTSPSPRDGLLSRMPSSA